MLIQNFEYIALPRIFQPSEIVGSYLLRIVTMKKKKKKTKTIKSWDTIKAGSL